MAGGIDEVLENARKMGGLPPSPGAVRLRSAVRSHAAPARPGALRAGGGAAGAGQSKGERLTACSASVWWKRTRGKCRLEVSQGERTWPGRSPSAWGRWTTCTSSPTTASASGCCARCRRSCLRPEGPAARREEGGDEEARLDGYGPVVVAALRPPGQTPSEQRKLGELLPKGGYRRLRKLDQRFMWLEGALGVPGKGPG